MLTGNVDSGAATTISGAAAHSASRSSSHTLVRAGRSSASSHCGCSSPATPTTRSPCSVTTTSSATRPGWNAWCRPCRAASPTPRTSATSRAPATASCQSTGRGSWSGPGAESCPAYRPATCHGWAGMPASRSARTSAEGWTARGGIVAEPSCAPGRKTSPISYSARSWKPRLRLRRAVSTRPGSSDRRRCRYWEAIGLARATIARAWPCASESAPKRRFCSSETKG